MVNSNGIGQFNYRSNSGTAVELEWKDFESREIGAQLKWNNFEPKGIGEELELNDK